MKNKTATKHTAPTALQLAIRHVCNTTDPRSAERLRALGNIHWVLQRADDGCYLSLDTGLNACVVDDLNFAMIYDGRDNDELRVKYFTALKRGPWVPTLITTEQFVRAFEIQRELRICSHAAL